MGGNDVDKSRLPPPPLLEMPSRAANNSSERTRARGPDHLSCARTAQLGGDGIRYRVQGINIICLILRETERFAVGVGSLGILSALWFAIDLDNRANLEYKYSGHSRNGNASLLSCGWRGTDHCPLTDHS